ncbi:hypothetical protein GCM10010402_62170 [Actinomadura luteofluorescens]|uniref:hypothetical protein n=1 Tax=Actinomadura luteofluorescens TaxID=46163 RepID=UPI002164BC2B|nr:hypothetical protein [Actinomadura glauciflava]MCR3742877.1 hypothetical protein [Actinomadura glauciflava]
MSKVPKPAAAPEIEGRFAALRAEFPGWTIGPSDKPGTPYCAVRDAADDTSPILTAGSYDALRGLLAEQDATDVKARLKAEFPGWSIIRSNQGRWWATRGPLTREILNRPSDLDADTAEGLAAQLRAVARDE